MAKTSSSVKASDSDVPTNSEAPGVGDTKQYSAYEEDHVRGCRHCVSKPDAVDVSDTTVGICHYTSLELPSIPLPLFNEGWAPLKQGGTAWLKQAVTAHAECLPKRDKLLCSHNTELESPDYLGNCDDLFEMQNSCVSNEEIKVPAEQKSRNKIERLQYDWCEMIKPRGEFLREDSKRIMRKVVRANAQVAFLAKDIDVPDVFAGDWERPLIDEYLPNGKGDHEELRQFLLPSDVVREDDAKIFRIPDKIVCIAGGYLRALQRSGISLTKASLNVPSVWNSDVVINNMARMTKELLGVEETLQKLPAPSTSLPLLLKSTRAPPKQCTRHQSDSLKNDETFSVNPLEESPSSATNVKRLVHNEIGAEIQLRASKVDLPLSTDYFLSDHFLRCNWSEPPGALTPEVVTTSDKSDSCFSEGRSKYHEVLHRIARPALWDLARKKLLQVDGSSFQNALSRVSLEELEAIVFQQFRVVKTMSLNPSTASGSEILEACASLRQAVWLHTLRMVAISEAVATRNRNMASAIVAKIISSIKYKLVLGASNWKDLHKLLKATRVRVHPPLRTIDPSEDESVTKGDLVTPPPLKKQRVLQAERDSIPVRVMCSVQLLENDELLDELCTEQRIFVIERDLPPPVDVLVDERNCICVVDGGMFQVETNIRDFIFSLARLQVQFQKCWVVIVLDTGTVIEDTMNLFFAAFVQFRVEIQVLTSFSCEETSRYVRAIVDECADVALSCHRILPRMWFERPFLLEEESQFERFLVSTKIINHYSAQSLLHKISMKDLFTKCIDELKPLVQNAITDEQLYLLWGFMHQNHGLNIAIA